VVGHVSKAAMISVIIPTLNRAGLLAQCLASLCHQLPEVEFEVIVIDNGSSDKTPDVIKDFKSKLLNLTDIYEPEPGLHNGRHAGMKSAKGDLLVFADDDIEALPTWLSSIEDAFKDPTVAMVGGNNYPMFLQPPPLWLQALWNKPTFRGYKSITSLSVIEFTKPQTEISPYQIWGCNFAIRKNVLQKAGGFHPDGMPKKLIRFRGDGETHVSRYVAELGLRCVFHPGASIYHKVTSERMTHAYFRQSGFNHGVSDSYAQLRQQNSVSIKASRLNLLKRALNYALRKTQGLLDSAEVKQAHYELMRGHKEGYAYHQACYRDDTEVREWVHRPTYFL
jgi:glycosyltransferase involved in cell wall biosynthesis